MKAILFLNKPTYWFHPSRVLSRLSRRHGRGFEDVRVAWGTTLTCNTSETLGRAIQNQGVFDLVVSEAICRLLRVGGTAIDVGAYVGHMTGLMAKQAGPNGRVISFEPSPRIRTTLSRNVARWANDRRFAPISIVASSASDRNGSIPSTTLKSSFYQIAGLLRWTSRGAVATPSNLKKLKRRLSTMPYRRRKE